MEELATSAPSLVITSFWKTSLGSQAFPRSLWHLGYVPAYSPYPYPKLDCKLQLDKHWACLVDPGIL